MKEAKVTIIFVAIVLTSIIASAHIGMRPARVDFDYKPGEEVGINYYVDTTPDIRVRMVAEGDMNESVKFSKTEMQGSGGFTTTIKMPQEAKKPGPNDLYIFVKQAVDEKGGIGTAISIGALVRINVPYPGKYLELALTTDNANKGEPVRMTLTTTNRGREEITFKPRIEIYAKEEQIDNIITKETTLKPTETQELTMNIDTKNYIPGEYKAIATIEYGGSKPAIAEREFRIGHLNIEIKNYTKKIIAGKISPFVISIQSDWKNTIEGVYANVTLIDEERTVLSFLTPPVTVTGFQEYELKGFADATNLERKIYEANISVNYQGRTTTIKGTVEAESPARTIMIIAGALLALIILILLSIYFYRRGRKNGKGENKKND